MSRSQRKWGGLTLVVALMGAFAIGIGLIAGPGKDAQPAKLRPPNETDVKSVADGNNRFALDLYGKLKKGDENLFYSPYSISTALAMTYAGARSRTAQQMAKALHFDLPPDRLHPACGGLIESLNKAGPAKPDEAGKTGDFQLSVANRLWGQKGEGFLKQFLDLTGQVYHAPFETLDFGGSPEPARKTINQWVEKQTADKVKDLLQPPDFSPTPVLILTNAIYMKADWLSKFDKQATEDEPFFGPGNRESKVPMMYQTAWFGYASEQADPQVLEMPYVGDRLSMVILLPQARDGLADLERRLTFDNVSKWLAGLKPKEILVALPRFTATQRFNLKEVLQSMGMVKAFGRNADFSGMNGKPGDLFISKVIHKAFVSVDEEGTEAAGATAEVMVLSLPPTFRADHPFVFLIRDRQTGAILFMGRVTEPKTEW